MWLSDCLAVAERVARASDPAPSTPLPEPGRAGGQKNPAPGQRSRGAAAPRRAGGRGEEPTAQPAARRGRTRTPERRAQTPEQAARAAAAARSPEAPKTQPTQAGPSARQQRAKAKGEGSDKGNPRRRRGARRPGATGPRRRGPARRTRGPRLRRRAARTEPTGHAGRRPPDARPRPQQARSRPPQGKGTATATGPRKTGTPSRGRPPRITGGCGKVGCGYFRNSEVGKLFVDRNFGVVYSVGIKWEGRPTDITRRDFEIARMIQNGHFEWLARRRRGNYTK